MSNNAYIVMCPLVAAPCPPWIDSQHGYMTIAEQTVVVYESADERDPNRGQNRERRNFNPRSHRYMHGSSGRGSYATNAVQYHSATHDHDYSRRGSYSHSDVQSQNAPHVQGNRGTQVVNASTNRVSVEPQVSHTTQRRCTMHVDADEDDIIVLPPTNNFIVEYKCSMTLGKACIELHIPQPIYKERPTMTIDGIVYHSFRATLRSPLIGNPNYCIGAYAPSEDLARENVARKLL
ncbi:hypothetical protein SESBI_40361 [Sesbania bispinosa]|nr:hypothetical protein SESBI_40361 [Sesbania bispinosa]